MKNCVLLPHKADIHEVCFGLLKSKPFIDSYENRGLIFDAIEAYARYPRIICDYSDHDLERNHFYPYLGVLPRRDYGDQYALSDLYYYHEQGHTIVAGYQERQPYSLWVNRLTQEEARTSVQSEMAIYFHLPDLRREVFQDIEIWADRYLKDDVKIFEGKESRLPSGLDMSNSNWDLFEADPELFTLFAMEKRANIMQSTGPEYLDEQEQLIHSYAANNFKWADIWRPVRDKVERAMIILARSSEVDREQALQAHMAYLTAEMGDDICPFHAQARAFRQVMIDFQAARNIAFMDKKPKP